jgi:hypothetical protein
VITHQILADVNALMSKEFRDKPHELAGSLAVLKVLLPLVNGASAPAASTVRGSGRQAGRASGGHRQHEVKHGKDRWRVLSLAAQEGKPITLDEMTRALRTNKKENAMSLRSRLRGSGLIKATRAGDVITDAGRNALTRANDKARPRAA